MPDLHCAIPPIMNTNRHPFLTPRLVIASIVAILLSGLAIAAMIAVPKSQAEGAAPPGVEAKATVRCAECGFVESTRELGQAVADRNGGSLAHVAQHGAKSTLRAPVHRYEVIVRMKDGSARVFIDPAPVQWRAGERLYLIGESPTPSG